MNDMQGIKNYYSYYNNLNSINNTYLNYTNPMNQLKLQQALEKLEQRQTNTDKNTATGSLNTSASTFVRNYNSSMADLMSAANSLRDVNASGISRELTVNSSDTDVLTATKNYTLRKEESFTVSVDQLAMAQQNVSQAVSSNAPATEDAAISITTAKGTANINVSAVKDNGVQKTNHQMLNDVAKQINRQNIGVRASVETTEDGQSVLKLTAKETGTDYSFSVTGDFAKNIGIDSVSTQAQNAEYSVTDQTGIKRDFISNSNEVSLDYGKATMSLQKTGQATVSIGVNNEKMADAVENLVDKYNKALSVVSSNTDKGISVKNQLSSMLSGPAPEKSLNLIGITKNADGTLSVNRDTLLQKLQEDPELTKDIISGNNGFAQGAFREAQSALSRPANALLSTELENMHQEASTSTLNLMHRFASSGAYNLTNFYSAGLLINMLV